MKQTSQIAIDKTGAKFPSNAQSKVFISILKLYWIIS